MVWPGELKGSRGRNCPLLPSSSWSASRVIPASTLTTMSACECSSTRSRPLRRRSMPSRAGGSPISAARPPPTGKTAMPASAAWWRAFATCSAVAGFSTVARLLRGPRELMAEPLSSWVLSPPLRLDREAGAAGQVRHLALWVGEDLARVHDPVHIERILHSPHRIQVVLAEHPRHERALLEPDPVLARQRATEFDDRAQHLLARA